MTPGTYTVTCRHCQRVGTLVLLSTDGETAEYREELNHAMDCPERPRARRVDNSWRRQERRAAKIIGGRQTLRSGAANHDGDARRFREWMVETKWTAGAFFRVSSAIWTTLLTSAHDRGERPALHIELGKPTSIRLVVIPQHVYDEFFTGPVTRQARHCTVRAGDPTPSLLPLEPPGVLLSEAVFSRGIRERE